MARIGGDEFVILLNDLKYPCDYEASARKLIRTVAEPYNIEANEISITISIGVSIFPTDGTDLASLLKKADLAMYYVKRNGKNNFQSFDSLKQEKFKDKIVLKSELQR